VIHRKLRSAKRSTRQLQITFMLLEISGRKFDHRNDFGMMITRWHCDARQRLVTWSGMSFS
jgi:hypothetical protein